MLHRLRKASRRRSFRFRLTPLGPSVMAGLVIHRSERTASGRSWGSASHLGCRIERVVGDEAVRPRHGLRFRSDGSVAAGPPRGRWKTLALEP
ncbi:MAG: hypothetical protein IPJ62_18080, partial [Betaproteobacteria bacterium]|nr:hypothetical protein [Betaproteobacteria bacterium]